ncbi:hypothetical protein [Winogradskyella sp. SYSU M77433]|uniref:hypothetical protein n=1 Tax=Winogradskyella sp. SYSU M77433 TaxID=3042722 RepID=UPI002480234B|nr:hypothetical protein [Winogradskyella sp. SYSU M77433]MDH7911515.1 hypothetical protein [Winogradskyella sp. SYSU M77433]
MEQLLFITTSSIASNPRLVKEFESLKSNYVCTVVCYKHHDWSLELSEKIKSDNKEVNFIEIDRKQKFLSTIVSKIKHKVAIRINPFYKNNYKVCAFASNDKTAQLLNVVKQLSRDIEFKRIVAHNLGAFYPAVWVSKSQDIDLQLDIEDYHPGESLYFNEKLEKTNRHRIMQYSFNEANTITYASEGIALECKKKYSISKDVYQLTIINAFKRDDFIKPIATEENVLKTVWFSQYIGPNRGLEQVFSAAKAHSDIEFHLIGNVNKEYVKDIVFAKNVIFHEVMSQSDLHEFLRTMDIGLALESEKADYNRNICLTNKFLAYVQAGLYVLATDTFGQRNFLESINFEAGKLIESSLSNELSKIDKNLFIHQAKINRWNSARQFSWEEEQTKLLEIF